MRLIYILISSNVHRRSIYQTETYLILQTLSHSKKTYTCTCVYRVISLTLAGCGYQYSLSQYLSLYTSTSSFTVYVVQYSKYRYSIKYCSVINLRVQMRICLWNRSREFSSYDIYCLSRDFFASHKNLLRLLSVRKLIGWLQASPAAVTLSSIRGLAAE